MLRSGRLRGAVPDKKTRGRHDRGDIMPVDSDSRDNTMEIALTINEGGMTEAVMVDQTQPGVQTLVRGFKVAERELLMAQQRLRVCGYYPIRGHTTDECRWKKRGQTPPQCENCNIWGHIISTCRQTKN